MNDWLPWILIGGNAIGLIFLIRIIWALLGLIYEAREWYERENRKHHQSWGSD